MTWRSFVALVLLTMICVCGGFFAGREELKYELRSAMADAASEISHALSAPIATPRPSVVAAVETPLNATLISKTFHQSDPQAGDFRSLIQVEVDFDNHGTKDIRAFDGVGTFTDLLDNEILSARIAINDPVKAGSKMSWKGSVEYNEFISAHQKLRAAPMANIKFTFAPSKILYDDGTTQTF